ncbi:hypothetical protein H4W32_005925 [Actinophytocola algeriensis]|uniref:Uncharacterized protein n=1 Tax=Actinophytocola algeriensis TaxID=1768010 RepID=A0A7W7VDQ2_9PSEU|nr:hypothetical protein [Actinophytocola algeriensis]MBE1477883.1 hypothetical protein [Actinophytocola algeriensis]
MSNAGNSCADSTVDQLGYQRAVSSPARVRYSAACGRASQSATSEVRTTCTPSAQWHASSDGIVSCPLPQRLLDQRDPGRRDLGVAAEQCTRRRTPCQRSRSPGTGKT